MKVTYLGYESLFAQWAESQGWEVTKRGWPDFICRRKAEIAVEIAREQHAKGAAA